MNAGMKNLTGVTVLAESGQKYRLTRQAGCGAQGIVYEESGGQYMVKMYYPSPCPEIDKDILERLRFIRDIQMPRGFVSVIDIIASPYPGYVMERVVEHSPLNSYLIPDPKIPFPQWYNRGLGLYERIFVGYVIAKAFGTLEKSNLSYCDISGNNILIRIRKGLSVRMIDVDNIYIAGKGKSAVLGTPRYIAPEVIRRQKNPDVLSDNYSLAVILFELLRVGHPYISDDVLNGMPEEEDAALAGGADYVTDENSTNMLPADVVLTGKLKELFRRCFVDGKSSRMRRPSATEFECALLEASNKVIQCPSCGAWHYPRKIERGYKGCPWCDAPSRPKALLNFYDLLFKGGDYKAACASGQSCKLVNSYVLKEQRKNIIKGQYILRYDALGDEMRAVENYLTIASTEQGHYLYNQFNKQGIVLKRYGSGTYTVIEQGASMQLSSGDEIYFELGRGRAVEIECGGTCYSFVRMARFMEAQR